MRKFLVGLLILVGLLAIVAIGGYFSLRRPDIPLATLEQAYGNAQSRYVDLPDGVRMHYRDEGVHTRPTILLVHGFSASLHTWEPWIAALGDRYRLVSIDLPGHGLTSAPPDYQASIEGYVREVEAFARSQELEHFTLIGNSMGGHVAWEYALAHPNQLDALVLVDAAGWPSQGDEDIEASPIFGLMSNPTIGPLLRDLDSTARYRAGLAAAFANPALANEPMIQRYVQLARAPGHRAILIHLLTSRDQRRTATNERLAAIRAPTLILWGDQDHLIPVADARLFAGAIPGSELITWADEGHVPQEEHPERSAEAVAAFLARVYAQQAIGTPGQETQQAVTPAP